MKTSPTPLSAPVSLATAPRDLPPQHLPAHLPALLGVALALVQGLVLFTLVTPTAVRAQAPVQNAGRAPAQVALAVPAPAAAAVDPERILRIYLDRETSGLPGRVEVSIGQVDERLKLAPCADTEPFIPTGARLWGRSMLGVRCKAGATWSVLVPVHVRVFAPVLVAAQGLQMGQPVTESDLRMEEIDLTREAPGLMTDPTQLGDSVLARPVLAGQPIRRDQLRPRPVIAQGDSVKLVYRGPGFSVSGSGRALNAAAAGQQVRVQTESGRNLSGTARAGRIVEMQ
jgi:flagella basal body P-ring formation protein FlgA